MEPNEGCLAVLMTGETIRKVDEGSYRDPMFGFEASRPGVRQELILGPAVNSTLSLHRQSTIIEYSCYH